MNHYIKLIIIVMAALILGSGIFLLAKKYGTGWISKIKSIVDCVVSALESAGVSSDRLSAILQLVVQAITYILATVTAGATPVTLAATALAFIQDVAGALGITLTDAETAIITDVLTMAFTFIIKINFTSMITSANYLAIYRQMAKNIDAPISTKLSVESVLVKHVELTLLKRRVEALEAA